MINKRKREVFEDIYDYGINKLLKKLFPLREKIIKEILRKKLREWRDKAKKLSERRAAETIQKNWLIHILKKVKKRIIDLLRDILNKSINTKYPP